MGLHHLAHEHTSHSFHEAHERTLVRAARDGDQAAMDRLIDRYRPVIRMKASSYFLAGGEHEDLIQEGLIGLVKAVRDYRSDRDTSFRSFLEICVTRQIITAIKTATRKKHGPMNTYVSFSYSKAGGDETTLADVLPGDPVRDPLSQVISREEILSLVEALSESLSGLEREVLRLYLDGCSYEVIGEMLDRKPKAVDNALQRVKRKIMAHRAARDAGRPLAV